MTSIKVKLRASNSADSTGTVYYQVIHERKVRHLATPYTLLRSEWNERRSAPGVSADSGRNRTLSWYRECISRDVERIRRITGYLEARPLVFTADDIIDEFKLFRLTYSVGSYTRSLIDLMHRHEKKRTAETYMCALRSFMKFRNNCDLTLDALSAEIVESYEAALRKRGNTPNTTSFYMRILRAVHNRAVDEGAIEDERPFRHVYTGVEKTVKRALPLPLIRKMKHLDLSANPATEYARDMFLMSFYLRGMSFIDLPFLRKKDLADGRIVYRRRKTGQTLHIGWTPEMQSLIDKYSESGSEYLLPILAGDVADKRKAYRNAAYRINRHLKKVGARLGLKIPLTMYCARHSWASAAKTKGIPLGVISEGMGHDSETTTRIYLASLESSVVDKANSIILNSL